MSWFFQAEDGIRDRSPSRGLGDVYKRQKPYIPLDGNIERVLKRYLYLKKVKDIKKDNLIKKKLYLEHHQDLVITLKL